MPKLNNVGQLLRTVKVTEKAVRDHPRVVEEDIAVQYGKPRCTWSRWTDRTNSDRVYKGWACA